MHLKMTGNKVNAVRSVTNYFFIVNTSIKPGKLIKCTATLFFCLGRSEAWGCIVIGCGHPAKETKMKMHRTKEILCI